MKKYFYLVFCINVFALVYACNLEDEDRSSKLPPYSESESAEICKRLNFTLIDNSFTRGDFFEDNSDNDYSQKKNDNFFIFGRASKAKQIGPKKTDCQEAWSLCNIRWIWQKDFWKKDPADNVDIDWTHVHANVHINNNNKTNRIRLNIYLADAVPEDVEMDRLILKIEEDITAIYDPEGMHRELQEMGIKADTSFHGPDILRNKDLVIVQNDYLFDPSLGPYGGYSLDAEFIDL